MSKNCWYYFTDADAINFFFVSSKGKKFKKLTKIIQVELKIHIL